MEMQVIRFLAAVTVLTCLGLCDSSQKKGMGVAWWSYVCGDMDVLNNMAWWYDWQQDTKHYITWYHCNEMWSHRWNYVPMVRRVNNESFHLEPHTSSGYVLGYNSPNQFQHANVTGRQAAAHWPEIERAAPDKKLVSPSAVPCGNHCHGGLFAWFDEFFHHCNGCRVDHIATHVYDCNATKVMDTLQQLYNRYGKKIWLTEFACPHSHSAARQLTFLKEILPLLEAADYVYRYAWFVHRERKGDGFVFPAISIMHNHTATLTALGQYYVDFGSTQPVVG